MRILSVFLIALSAFSLSACKTTESTRLMEVRTRVQPELNKELTAMNLRPGAPVYLRLFKEERILETWVLDTHSGRYQPFKTYPICKFSGGLGPKLSEGDHQAPEGFYEVSEDWMWPESKYHLAMNIGFPNEYDLAHKRTGSYLMIHGDCQSEGCYAMTDPAIEEIYLLVDQSLSAGNDYVPVHIFPFRMTTANMTRYYRSPWLPFWANLKQGHDLFERYYMPPVAWVQDGRYVFSAPVYAF